MTHDPEGSLGQRSLLSSLGLGSFGKATGALGAPVAGLIALAAIGAAGAGVGAGLGSLPGKPPLAGSSGRPAAAHDSADRLALAPGVKLGHGGVLRDPVALASMAGPLAKNALAGAGLVPRSPSANGRQTSGGRSSRSPTGGRPVGQSMAPAAHGILQRPSRPSDLGSGNSGQPSGPSNSSPQPQGSSRPQSQPSQWGSPQQSPNDGGSGQSNSGSSSPSSIGSSSSSSSSSSGSSSSGSEPSQTTTTSSNSPQTTSTSSSSPPTKSNGGAKRPATTSTSGTGTTTTPSDS